MRTLESIARSQAKHSPREFPLNFDRLCHAFNRVSWTMSSGSIFDTKDLTSPSFCIRAEAKTERYGLNSSQVPGESKPEEAKARDSKTMRTR